ncbi:MAG: excalibur calcium-binding domain-containing protein [Hyphomicrobiaceae bacterium]|nr:excalibur calcium-binding domain-containing protein [Hyphomicrobiaceae bacterium]
MFCLRAYIVYTLSASFSCVVFAQGSGPFNYLETTCKHIESCAEAAYKLEVCGHTKRDRDNVGIPCENLCGNDKKVYRARVQAMWPSGMPHRAIDDAVKPDADLNTPLQASTKTEAAMGEMLAKQPAFACQDKRYCRQMVSCDEARFYLVQCGVRSLDGDRDGVPCNALCGQR